ncbi:DHA2 family efflux MFS transporter permease subunit [Paracoccus shanxieyensis]|uniref:DHA2 family efflux MFS transporter permease subunit n=1 Tax=Paracoccus shanxieyensis TaxID=2675752 RepID=A0A6L6IYY7_9RHOB|nr:DHA2 family efflux MFS transporter permease subunit [Paracoccus shanxieyensis]MTH64310.1 DHA2 family efflux MFS transporter permease subunit [Paracoccus shanxieyensis]MTH87454.1 DHA2 family efflux MFS transporter permease subunit [Paracoccus shanxieyensis]
MAADIAAPAAPALDEDRIDPRRLITFLLMVLGMFMAILDIQIVSASLPEIQAGLAASGDEIPWIQTSYLIAEVIMIPLSGYLSRMLSTRWLFTISAGGFTLMSLLCGLSNSIGEMIVWRALQGFIGGAMIPTVFACAFTIFPRSKMHIVSPMIGLVATLAPTIGPTLGGYLTEYLSWHWLFFINIIPGIVVTTAAFFLIDFDKPDLSLFDRFDWWGFLGLALFLGAMEYVLEEGAGDDWFADHLIVMMTAVMVAGGFLFFWRAFTAEEPIVRLDAFADRNFAMGSIFSFGLGIGLYGLIYIFPVYLSGVRGYNSLQIGEAMMVSGISMFLTAPIAGRLSQTVDPRIMMGVGFLLFSGSCWMMTGLTEDWDYWEIFIPQIMRGVSLMLCMVPVSNIALGMLPPDKVKNASGLFNLTRNLGGAVGLALINTILRNREDFHYARIAESVTAGSEPAMQTQSMLEQAYSGLDDAASQAALATMTNMAKLQALVMSLADIFVLLTFIFAGLALLLTLVAKPKGMGGGGGGGH